MNECLTKRALADMFIIERCSFIVNDKDLKPMRANQPLLKLIQEVADMLKRLTGWQVEVRPMGHTALGERPDGLLTIGYGGRNHDFAIESRGQISAPMLPRIVEQLRADEESMRMPGLLLAPYLAPAQTAALRQSGVSYADLKGNVHLTLPGLEVWFVGAARGLKDVTQHPPTTQWETMTSLVAVPHHSSTVQRETLTTAGVRLIYGLLSDPKRASAPYRDLAKRAGVSLGSVKATLDWLQRREFLRVFGQGRRAGRVLVKRRELLERWTEAYGERLRPKLQIGRYTAQGAGPTPMRRVDTGEPEEPGELQMTIRSYPAGAQATWSGEMAASLLLGERHYKSGTMTLYLYREQDLNLFLAQNKLSRDASGEVEILGAFWPQEDEIQAGVAHPLVVYADLMNAASSRCWEAARLIYERYLKEQVEHDS